MGEKDSPTKILIVDGEEKFLYMLSIILKKRGYKVFTASSGEYVLDILGREKIDIAILNTRIPGMEGFELTSRINKKYPAMEIILTADRPSPQDETKRSELRFARFIQKPFRPDEIREIVEECVDDIRLRTKADSD